MIKHYFIGNETSGPKLIKALEEKAELIIIVILVNVIV